MKPIHCGATLSVSRSSLCQSPFLIKCFWTVGLRTAVLPKLWHLSGFVRIGMIQINVRRDLLAAGIRQLCDAEFSFDISMVLKELTTLQTLTNNQSAEFKQCDGFLFTCSEKHRKLGQLGEDTHWVQRMAFDLLLF